MNGKVRIIPLFYRLLVQTDGTETWMYIDLDADEVSNWGPHVEAIGAHVKTQAIEANMEWKLVSYWSTDGQGDWEGPFDVFAAVSTNGQTIPTPFTDRSKFGIHMRYALGVRNTTTGSDRRSATVSCALAFEFLT